MLMVLRGLKMLTLLFVDFAWNWCIHIGGEDLLPVLDNRSKVTC